MPMLPSSLVHNPRRKQLLTEPILHYGWIIDESRLLDVVKRKKIGAEYEEEPIDEKDHGASVHKWINMKLALQRIAEEIGLTHPPELTYVHDHDTRKCALFVSLLNNYNCQSFQMDRNDITKTQAYFEVTKPALWHLDFTSWRWRRP